MQMSRPASVAASIAVLEEGGGGAGAAAASSSGQQHEQQAAASSSSGSREGGSSQGEIEPRGSGEASSSAGGDGERPLSRLPSRGPPTCLICLEVRAGVLASSAVCFLLQLLLQFVTPEGCQAAVGELAVGRRAA